jgi:hypothetical protein
MQQQQRSVSANLDAYEAVFTALAKYGPGSILSTRDVLTDIRQLCPSCEHTDEELVGFIVETLTGQTIGVCFDHRDAAWRSLWGYGVDMTNWSAEAPGADVAREGRNPSTGATIKIAASRKLSFAPAKAVKDALNG